MSIARIVVLFGGGPNCSQTEAWVGAVSDSSDGLNEVCGVVQIHPGGGGGGGPRGDGRHRGGDGAGGTRKAGLAFGGSGGVHRILMSLSLSESTEEE